MAELLYTFRLPSEYFENLNLGVGLSAAVKQALLEEVERHLEAVERRHLGNEGMVKVLANVPGYSQLLGRRAALGLVELEVRAGAGGEVQVVLGGDGIGELEGPEFGKWLGRCLAAVLSLPEGALEHESAGVEGRPQAVRGRRMREEGSGGFLRRMGYILLFVPMLTAMVMLFFVWSWISDLQADYQDLKNTVTLHKEQIIDAVEEGVKRSADVMDLYDAAKGSDLWERVLGNEAKPDSSLNDAK